MYGRCGREVSPTRARSDHTAARAADPVSCWLWAGACYVAAAVVVGWPIPARLFSDLPLGALPDPVLPWFNLWTLQWNADRLLHGYADYWNAPIFHPTPASFALSEPQGLTGAWFALWQWMLGPVAAYNVTLGSLLVGNALAARRLARVCGVSSASASWVGVLVLALPYVQRELGVLQLCALWPVLLGLSELRAVVVDADPRALLRGALFLCAALWTCAYYALFFAVFLLPVPLFIRQWRERVLPLLAAGAAAALLVLLACWPILSVQRKALTTAARSSESIHQGSANIWTYLKPPAALPAGQCVPSLARPPQRRTLYPGLVVFVLAALGARRARVRASSRFLGYASVVFVVALLLSFGTRWHMGGFVPYETLVQHVLPGFAQMRSPYRAAVFVQSWLAVFAGFGLDAVSERVAGADVRFSRFAGASCVALALLELWPGPQRTQRFPYEALHEPWVNWLSKQPAGAVALLPPAASPKVGAYAETVLGMLQGLVHGHPLVNGYSGFFPTQTDRLMALLPRFPAQTALRALARHGVRYAVVDQAWAAQHGVRTWSSTAPGLQLALPGAHHSVYLLTSASTPTTP